MLKLEFRKKIFYPLMLLLFIFLRIVFDIILKIHPYKENIEFVVTFLIFFSQSLIGAIIYLYYYSKSNKINEVSYKLDLPSSNIRTSLFRSRSNENKDNKSKKIFLIIFASFFNFVGSIIRSADVLNFGKREENNSQLEVRIRSIQIIISSLLCYFTLGLNIYKHQKLSLIIISFFLALTITLEFCFSSTPNYKVLSIIIVIMSCSSRAFLDVTEKYLFEYDYINILSMLIYEGLIGVFFFIIYFIVNKTYQDQGRNIIKDMSHFDWKLITFILLIIAYTIISGFRNAYRVTTNKYYSPMSRALFESTLDPFLFIYNFFTLKFFEGDSIRWIYFGVILFGLLVIAFFSLVYNDFIVLNCYGLSYNTYNAINSRLNSDNIERNDTVIDVSKTITTEGSNEGSEEQYEMKVIK